MELISSLTNIIGNSGEKPGLNPWEISRTEIGPSVSITAKKELDNNNKSLHITFHGQENGGPFELTHIDIVRTKAGGSIDFSFIKLDGKPCPPSRNPINDNLIPYQESLKILESLYQDLA